MKKTLANMKKTPANMKKTGKRDTSGTPPGNSGTPPGNRQPHFWGEQGHLSWFRPWQRRDHFSRPPTQLRLARSHARTKRNDFPVGGLRSTSISPPNLRYKQTNVRDKWVLS